MAEQLTKQDYEYILECLEYTRRAYREYRDYPSEDFRQQQLERLSAVVSKLRGLRDQMPEQAR